MKTKPIPEYFKEHLIYRDGKLYWSLPLTKNGKEGEEISVSLDSYGYHHTRIHGENYRVHRIVWFLIKGEQPPDIIDHINNDRGDNRIENLREATKSQNNFNSVLAKTNTSGFKNVYWCKQTNKWRVQVKAYGYKKCFGRYEDLEKAKEVAVEARKEMHKEFANNG
jgi:hypothetical protein